MKSLTEYIRESKENATSKTFIFNFDGLEHEDEMLKSLTEYPCLDIDEKKVSIKISKDNLSDINTALELLQEYSHTLRSSSKRSSSENYAQKTVKFADTLADIYDYIDELSVQDDDTDNKEDE